MTGLPVGALVAILAGFGAPAAAHPHHWVEITGEVRFDAAGRVTALHQTWRYDELSSAVKLAGLDWDLDGAPDPDKLATMAELLLDDLSGEAWYVTLLDDDGATRLGPPAEVSAEAPELRLTLSFSLPLAPARDPRQAPIAYMVYDPSFQTQFLHAAPDAVRLAGGPPDCGVEIEPARPSARLIAQAAAIDLGAASPPDLGAGFADRVRVRCGE